MKLLLRPGYGLQSVAASDFFTGGSRFFSLGPAIRWPIFNAGRIRQNIKVQNLRQEQALLAYEQTVLIAIEKVENALVAYRQAQLRLHELTEAEKAQQRAVVLAQDRYRSGLVDFLDVIEAERSLYTSQAQTVQGERAVSQNLVRLYKALGGGWEEDIARKAYDPASPVVKSPRFSRFVDQPECTGEISEGIRRPERC